MPISGSQNIQTIFFWYKNYTDYLLFLKKILEQKTQFIYYLLLDFIAKYHSKFYGKLVGNTMCCLAYCENWKVDLIFANIGKDQVCNRVRET